MRPDPLLIGGVTDMLETAATSVGAALARQEVEEEPDFTSQFVGEARAELRKRDLQGVDLRMKVLTSHGAGTQEPTYGGDLLTVLSIDLPDYTITKGFLAQAKLEGKRENRGRLLEQARKMLRVTPDAYVIVESDSGLAFFAASGVVATKGELDGLREKPIGDFVLDFMTSFIGDGRLDAATEETLRTLLEEYNVRFGALVTASPIAL